MRAPTSPASLRTTRWLASARGWLGGSAAFAIALIPGPCCSFNDLSVPTDASVARDASPDASDSGMHDQESPDTSWDGPQDVVVADADADAADSDVVDAVTDGCQPDLADCDNDQNCETNVMTDKNHCGVCNHSCLRGECSLGQCQPFEIASGQASPSGIAMDGTHIYWANSAPQGAIMRAPMDGGAPEAVQEGMSSPLGIVVDSDAAFWTTHMEDGGLWRMDKAGMLQGGVAYMINDHQATPAAIAENGAYIYWTTANTVRRIGKDGQGRFSIVADHPTVGGVAVDKSGVVYWTNLLTGSIETSPGEPDAGFSILVSGQRGPAGIAVDLGNVYWTNQSVGDPDAGAFTVVMMPKVGGSPVTIADHQGKPTGIAVNGNDVFWANTGSGEVMRASVLSPGVTHRMASGQEGATGIAANAKLVCWTNIIDGRVMAVAR